MAHIVGFERDQFLLLRAAGDDHVEADNPLRFIDAFVDGWPLQRRGLRASKPRRRAGPAARRGALRSVRRPMRPKRPQFPATRSSVTARARCGPRGSFGDQGHPPEDDSRGGDSAADFVNPTSRGNAVTEYWFQPRIESARYVRPRSADDCFTSTPDIVRMSQTRNRQRRPLARSGRRVPGRSDCRRRRGIPCHPCHAPRRRSRSLTQARASVCPGVVVALGILRRPPHSSGRPGKPRTAGPRHCNPLRFVGGRGCYLTSTT